MMEETSDWSSSFLVLSAFLGLTSFLEGALEGALEGDFSLLLLLDLSEPASDFFFLDLESGMIQTEYILSHYSIRFILTTQGLRIHLNIISTPPMRTVTLLVVMLALCGQGYCQLPEDDEVLSGFPDYPHTFYSGYLDVSVAVNLKSIHYVYFESQKDHAKDPVILWLAGGPGCSGLISMLQENGPFLITPGTEKIGLNPNAWNKRANLVYFELPAGVGFSTASKDESINDETTIYEAMVAIRLFLDRHKNLKKNELYIAGSGYGATFANKFAREIINANKDPASVYEDKINLKGLLLGNPCIMNGECFSSGSERNSFYHYEFLYQRGFFPKSVYQPFLGKCAVVTDPYECYKQRQILDKNYNATNTSAYNIYAKCYKAAGSNTINMGCEDEVGPITYLNDADFKRNWNIREIEGHKWEPCSERIWGEYTGSNGTYHLLDGLIKDHMRVWVYSGDMDSTVPITGTKVWLHNFKNQFHLPVKRNWREWWVPGKHKGEDQVGGFIWELEGLTFVAVKGAGFKAGSDQPVALEEVLNGFLDDQTLPYKS